jgi:hypothetical protein
MHTIFWLVNLKGRDHLEDNLKMDVGQIRWEGVGWIHVTVHGNEPSGSIKC